MAIDDDKKIISDKKISSLESASGAIMPKSDVVMENKEELAKKTISPKDNIDKTTESKDIETEKKSEDLSIKAEFIKNKLPNIETSVKEETISQKELSTSFSKDEVSAVSKNVDVYKQDIEVQESKTDILTEKQKNTKIEKEESVLDTESIEADVVLDKKDENNNIKDFLSAMFSNNPVFVLMLGLGPALAVTTKLTNGIGLGLIVLLTTLLSNVVVSALKGFIPAKIRLPFYLTITGSFVSVIIIFVKIFLPDLATSLGIFLPLTAVNSVILERTEVFACKKKITDTILNSLGTGIGFMSVLVFISFIREFFGTLQLDFSDFGLGVYGFEKISILGIPIYEQAKMFVMPVGAFLTLGLLLAVKQAIHNYSNKNIED